MKNKVIILATMALSLTTFAKQKTIRAEDIQKVKTYYMTNGLGDGDTNLINPNQLQGSAKTKFNKLQNAKECQSFGYCPEAYAVDAAGIKTIAVSLSNDGGQFINIYTEEGSVIATCAMSESSDLSCN